MAGHFVGETQDMQIMHNGILIKRGSYHGEWMSEIIQKLRGHHEPQVWDANKVSSVQIKYHPYK